MKFTNQLITKRNFYTQNNNFGLDINFSVDDPLKKYEFGISGNNSIYFVLESGKILYNNIFIHSYLPNYQYNIQLGVSQNFVNITKDTYPLIYGNYKNTGDYNYFYFKRADNISNAIFDFSVSGQNIPYYSIDEIGYYFGSGQNIVTGFFHNISGYDINVFQSQILSTTNISYSGTSGFIHPQTNLPFYYSGDFSSFNFSQPIFTSFNTNIGQINVNFNIIDATTLARFVLLNKINDFSFDTQNTINRTVYYTNYSGSGGGAIFDTDMNFQLKYISGSGVFSISDFAQSASFLSTGYGNFFQSGIISGLINIPTGNSFVTGIYSINFNRFQWATGVVSGIFTGIGTGISSGINYTGAAYGFFSGVASGIIQDGSGSLNLNNITLQGYSSGVSYAINSTGNYNATGYINISGLMHNDIIYIGDSTPIIKGFQYNNLTGLNYYLNNNSEHKVTSNIFNDIIYLSPRVSGELGNSINIALNDCNIGSPVNYSPFLIGGGNIGPTGSIVYALSPFIGMVNALIFGSGDYALFVSGNEHGIFTFERTFTGTWDLFTGLSASTLAPVKKYDNIISGGSILSANSSIIFQINHKDSIYNTDGIQFLVSGKDIINPINISISQ